MVKEAPQAQVTRMEQAPHADEIFGYFTKAVGAAKG